MHLISFFFVVMLYSKFKKFIFKKFIFNEINEIFI